jgi:hypothetical protein
MFYKRPSLRRGGMPTGIEQLTPRTQVRGGGNIGGGLFTGSNLGTRTGFNQILGISEAMAEELQRGKPNYSMKAPTSRLGRLLLTNPKTVYGTGIGAGVAVGTGIGLLADAYQRSTKTPLAYKKLKEVSSRPFYFDETNLDFEEGLKEIDDANKIGEAPGFFPRGGKKKLFKDKGLDEDGLSTVDIDKRGDPAQFSGEDELTDFDAIAKKMIANKNEIKSKDTQVGGDVVEDSFDSEYDKQMKRLEKYLGTSNRETKGRLALALSDAVGTEGTIADKAAALNKSLLGIMGQKRKDKKDMAKIAFAATTELEKARIAAGKKGFQERNFNEYASLATKTNRTPSEEKRFQILKDGLGIKTGLTGSSATTAGKIANEVNKNITSLQDAAENEKSIIQSEIIAGINQLLLIQGVTTDNVSGIVGYDVSPYLGLKKAKGGRIEMAVGGPPETPTEPVATNLTFEQLRTRLPKEITDDIVKLVATSEEALQDFAYIRTQGDVEKFNVKYGVNLILPQNTA